MNRDRDLMNSALKDLVIPELRERGFKGSLPHFRRRKEKTIHLLSFQFDRHGGGFIIEIARAPNQPFKTSWGEIIKENKITAHDLDNRLRIHPKGILVNSPTEDWFRFDGKSFFHKNIFKKVAMQVLNNLNVAEQYWNEDI